MHLQGQNASIKLVVQRQTDRQTDIVTYRAAIAAKNDQIDLVIKFINPATQPQANPINNTLYIKCNPLSKPFCCDNTKI